MATSGQGASSSSVKGGNRRNKMRAPGSSVKSEAGKGDIIGLNIHTRVQDLFASHLSQLLNDPLARDLQCCVTYGKPCGCIRKYIIAGIGWKDNAMPNLHIGQNKDKDEETIANSDRLSIHDHQISRANELLEILHRSAELKKEKCYSVASEGADGKPLKELRGMIGLGNGRKRSKKYEDYVLDKRSLLRNEYSLCEKAAQKLLGYSINFLYKKLRTNPQKTSRLVATNNAERASKVPRHLISLAQLREMATNPQGNSQCCCRNCISWLVKQHFDKIVNWRQRLEGSGQRVAQEIVAEVLLASASLDGQNSFCQNLVHWVTGCSFKKIRRVRDHLKKDPKSLPEHGLKKYWKDKANKGSGKVKSHASSAQMVAKSEKDTEYFGVHHLERFPTSYDARANLRANETTSGDNQISNLNSNNNRFDSHFRQTGTPNPPHGLFHPQILSTATTTFNTDNAAAYQNISRQQEADRIQQMYPLADANNNTTMLANLGTVQQSNAHGLQQSFRHSNQVVPPNAEIYQNVPEPSYAGQMATNNFGEKNATASNQAQTRSSVIIQARQAQVRESTQFHPEQAPNHQVQQSNYSQNYRAREDPAKFYPAPLIASLQDSSFNENGQPSYYLAAPGTANAPQEGLFQTGMTPLFLAQAQQPEVAQGEQEANSQFSGQSFFLLSPALPNGQDKGGFDFENWKQRGMPLTPIQMYPYFTQNGEGADNKNMQGWNGDPQHFMFPMTDANMTFGQAIESNYSDANNHQQAADHKRQQGVIQSNQIQQQYFAPALTPVAVMPQGGHIFPNMSWIAAPLQEQAANDTNEKSAEAAVADNANMDHRQKYYQDSTIHYPGKTAESYYEPPARPQQLAVIPQWPASSQAMFVADQSQIQGVQWPMPVADGKQAPQVASAAAVVQNANEQVQQVAAGTSNESQTELRRQMPALAPLPAPGKVPPPPVKDMPELTAIEPENDKDDAGPSSPKVAAIANRSKRFSRDRLRATIDSPCLPPMTPLTPALTPNPAALGSSTHTGDSEARSGTPSPAEKPLNSQVFRFPPAHVSRRLAAIRLQGQTMDVDKAKSQKSPDGTEEQEDMELESGDAEKKRVPGKSISGPLESASSLGYIPDALLQGELVDLTNVKSLPELSLPSAGWTDDTNMNVTVKDSDKPPNQQLKTPTQVLTTPTSNTTPTNQGTSPSNQLHTPTHPLSTPTQPLNTPTQPLNTPTQPLNTPNQLNTPTQPLNTPTHDMTSPSHSSTLQASDEDSPVKELQPVPTGRKRKPEPSSAAGSDKSAKYRFHHFTPQDYKKDGFTPTAYHTKSEAMPGIATYSDSGKGRRTPRKQIKPKSVHDSSEGEQRDTDRSEDENLSDKADNDQSTDKDVQPSKQAEAPKESLSSISSYPQLQFSNLQTPLLQRITPVFSMPTSSADDGQQSSTQLNTPVFLHSTLMTPSSRVGSSLIRKPSPAQITAAGRTQTPQFFTFMPGGGFQTPTVFFTPPDMKKSKTADGDDSEKKRSPEKRIPRALTLSQGVKDDALQTPSKIAVVTPSATLNSAGLISASNMSHIFSFQDPNISAQQNMASKQNTPEKEKTPEAAKVPKEDGKSQREPKTASDESSMAPPSAIPMVLVDPPSDGESSDADTKKKTKTKDTKEKNPHEGKQTLHRVRSGGKSDLVISLKSSQPGEVDLTNQSPLNTPSGIQVITPTMGGGIPTPGKNGSPVKRLPQALRVHPQPLVVAPICINPNNSQQQGQLGMQQVQTPTFFHIISPSQHTPPSPSVVMYPYPPRGFGAASGARTGSPAGVGSPFGIIQRGGSTTSVSSGSLLKSALIKKLPVFQFPPPTSNPPTSPAPAATDKPTTEISDAAESSSAPCSSGSTSEPAVTTESSTPVSVICRPTSSNTQLADKLSGANDPCLSEAAQEDP